MSGLRKRPLLPSFVTLLLMFRAGLWRAQQVGSTVLGAEDRTWRGQDPPSPAEEKQGRHIHPSAEYGERVIPVVREHVIHLA